MRTQQVHINVIDKKIEMQTRMSRKTGTDKDGK